MANDFPFVIIRDHLKTKIGEPDKGTRLYRRYGTEEEMHEWFNAVTEICHGDGSVSPGGAAGYVKVSRPAVHKRLKEGRLTGFLFHVVKTGKFFKEKKKLAEGGRPYAYIPVVECKAWASEMEGKRGGDVTNEMIDDYSGSEKEMVAPSSWKKRIV